METRLFLAFSRQSNPQGKNNMDTDLLRRVFADEPDVISMLDRKNTDALFYRLMLEKLVERIRVAKGEKGDTGEIGLQGIQGIQGIQGLDGQDGKNGKDGRNGNDGKDGRDGKDGSEGKNGEKGADAIADLDSLFKDFVKRLQKEKSLDISNLRNAESFIFNKTKYNFSELMHGGGSTGGGSAVFSYNISSQFNGILTTFTLPTYASILQITITGWPPEGALNPSTDFTTPTTTTITLDAALGAPVSGTTGIILYTT